MITFQQNINTDDPCTLHMIQASMTLCPTAPFSSCFVSQNHTTFTYQSQFFVLFCFVLFFKIANNVLGLTKIGVCAWTLGIIYHRRLHITKYLIGCC